MAKTIKFNLICDGHQIRSLEDIREHFSIEDILSYYKNGLLNRWLSVRGFSWELEEVNTLKALQDQSNITIIKNLARIFEVETDEKIIEENTYILNYQEQQKESAARYAQQKAMKEDILREYHQGYANVIRRILEHEEDMAVIKAAVAEIDTNYRQLFDLDCRMLFEIFYNYAPKAIFAMLMRSYMRDKYLVVLPEKPGKEDILQDARLETLRTVLSSVGEEDLSDVIKLANTTRKNMRLSINKLIQNTEALTTCLGDDVRVCNDRTAPYNKDLENKGKFMILKIGSGDKVHSYGAVNQDLEFKDIDGKFVILDGLSYYSDSTTTAVYYMEV